MKDSAGKEKLVADLSIGQRLDRRILRQGFRAGWPLLALYLIEARRLAARPVAYLEARRKAQQLLAASPWSAFVPRESGYRLFPADTFQEAPAIVAACRDVYARHAHEIGHKAVNKPYFYNILTEDDLRAHPILADFALSAAATEAVAGYLGQVPRLHSLGVFYSAVNDTIDGSQMYHVDGDALNQVKCFVNIWDVGPGGGGLTFFPKPLTSRPFRHGGLLKTLRDSDIYRAVPEKHAIVADGPPGSGLFIDTCRCLHQGSRATERPRLIFQFQYVPRPDTLPAYPVKRVVPGGHLHVSRSLLKGFKFSNPNALMFVD
jgi:hypothetical protein